MINKEELLFKLEINLKENNGNNHKLYNHGMDEEPNSNIVEYAEVVKYMVELLQNIYSNTKRGKSVLLFIC